MADSHTIALPLAETDAQPPIPLSPPCGGKCHGVTEGGSVGEHQMEFADRTPPLPSASPPQGGRRRVVHRSLAGGAVTE